MKTFAHYVFALSVTASLMYGIKHNLDKTCLAAHADEITFCAAFYEYQN